MIEQVLKGKNLYEAYRQVVRNKGASGVDRMKVGELKAFFIANHQKVKSNGKMRLLGVPTVVYKMATTGGKSSTGL